MSLQFFYLAKWGSFTSAVQSIHPPNNIRSQSCIGCHSCAQPPNFAAWAKAGLDVMNVNHWRASAKGQIRLPKPILNEVRESKETLLEYIENDYIPPPDQVEKWHEKGVWKNSPWK